MVRVMDAIDDGVAHIEVAAGKVDFCAQRHCTVGEFSRFHASKERKTFLDGTVAIGADRRVGQITAVVMHFIGRQFTDIGEPFFDQSDREVIHRIKIVGRIIEPIAPVKAQPVDVFLDGIDIFGVLFGGVGIVHAQVADAAVFQRRTEVDAQRLGMSYMQIAVRLRRETRVHGLTVAAASLGQFFVNDRVDKVGCGCLGGRFQFFSHLLTPPL